VVLVSNLASHGSYSTTAHHQMEVCALYQTIQFRRMGSSTRTSSFAARALGTAACEREQPFIGARLVRPWSPQRR
jgi:hypothetical protein